MRKIMLGQILQYFDQLQDPVDRIQIVTTSQDWDNADEVSIDSDLLIPFGTWIVTELRYELSYYNKKPLVRVSIEPIVSASDD